MGLILLYGIGACLLIVRYIIHQMYSGRIPDFARSAATQLALAVIGALFFCLFMSGLLKSRLRGIRVAFGRLVFSAGLRGMLSTILALEVFYVLTSFHLALSYSGEPRPSGLSQHMGVFLLWFIEVQTYGLVPMFIVAPLSFLMGALVGIWISRLAKTSLVVV
jgi:hypothetical protein